MDPVSDHVPDPRAAEVDRLRERVAEAAHRSMESQGWPPDLVKAAEDPFEYAAYVRGLGVVWFESAADLGGGWVMLKGIGNHARGMELPPLPFPFCRGVNVRLEDIRWVADAPRGS